MLSFEAISEFKKIYEQEFGEKISDAEAQMLGNQLLNLFEVIYRPLKEDRKDYYDKETEQVTNHTKAL